MPRALRVGLLLNEQLVEERTFTSAVTFGSSLRCSLSVPIDGVPREHVLFTVDRGRFVLHPLPVMQVIDGKKLVIGEATILFHEIELSPPPRLPAELRRTLGDRIDRRLAVILGASLAVHLGIAIGAWLTDVETEPALQAAALESYEQIDVTIPDLAPPSPPTTTAPSPGIAAPVRPSPTIVRSQHAVHATSSHDASQLASILTNADPAPRHVSDLDKELAAARDREFAIGTGTQTSRSNDNANIDDRHAPLSVGPPSRSEAPPLHATEQTGRIEVGTVKPGVKTTLTADVILEWIRTRYLPGLRRCYRLGLQQDSTLSGRVTLGFTVDARGQVIDPDATGVSSGVDSCIEKQMSGWRFPAPHDAHGQPIESSTSISLALLPT